VLPRSDIRQNTPQTYQHASIRQRQRHRIRVIALADLHAEGELILAAPHKIVYSEPL
jgi:hypothetical protein